MIKIIAKCLIKNDHINEFKVIAEKLVDATRSNDTGCISYELCQDREHENTFVFMETWEDLQAINQHVEQPHFKHAVEQIALISEQEMIVNIMNLVK